LTADSGISWQKRLITTVAVQVEAANEHDKETSEVFEAAIGCNEEEVPSHKELGFPEGVQEGP
jgi:hypothetical protein